MRALSLVRSTSGHFIEAGWPQRRILCVLVRIGTSRRRKDDAVMQGLVVMQVEKYLSKAGESID